MRRRDFIALLGGVGAVSWPRAGDAQQLGGVRRVSILWTTVESDRAVQIEIAALKQALAQLGWIEGQNIRFEVRFAAPDSERSRASARELIALPVDLLFCSATPATAVLMAETRTIPIVFVNVSDPLGSGFAASLARPGGNVTGFTNFEATVSQKWLELLKEVAPNTARVGVLFNPATAADAGQYFFKPIESAARVIGIEPIPMPVRTSSDIESAVSQLAGGTQSGLIPLPDAFLSLHRNLVASLALRHRIPAIYGSLIYVPFGGLICHGIDRLDQARRAAFYVNRILKGEKPADLPVQGPTKYELVINLKTAKAMGLEVPLFLQQRADQVIE